jgi:23S rRNA (uridine2552-2'-O)-methyltransferase
VLHGRRASRVADRAEQRFALVAIASHDADLDQFVRIERALDLRDHGRCKARIADQYDGIERMGAPLQNLALGGRKQSGDRSNFSMSLFHDVDSIPMTRGRANRTWMQEHVRDPYVKRAQAQGLRSRAAFKLLELDAKDRLFSPGQIVVDLGAAPGSWSEIAMRRVGPGGKVIAIDLLEMAPITGVSFIRGDFAERAALDRVERVLGGSKADLVLSDMAPNISGVPVTDQARSLQLAELAADFAVNHLKPDGALVVKLFQGGGFPEFLNWLRKAFESVASRKPDASRDRSREMYLLARRPRSPGSDLSG